MSRIARFRCTEQKPVPSHWVGSGGPFQNMHVCLEAFTRPITGLLGDKLVIFTDAQAALSRLRNHDEGPGQQIARWAFKTETALCREGVSIEYRWVPLACRL
jgi:hypothetical protein